MTKLIFDYKSQTEPMDYIIDLAYDLHDFEEKEIRNLLSAPYLLTEYDPETIRTLMQERLRPENMLITLCSNAYENEANLQEKWMKGK